MKTQLSGRKVKTPVTIFTPKEEKEKKQEKQIQNAIAKAFYFKMEKEVKNNSEFETGYRRIVGSHSGTNTEDRSMGTELFKRQSTIIKKKSTLNWL